MIKKEKIDAIINLLYSNTFIDTNNFNPLKEENYLEWLLNDRMGLEIDTISIIIENEIINGIEINLSYDENKVKQLITIVVLNKPQIKISNAYEHLK